MSTESQEFIVKSIDILCSDVLLDFLAKDASPEQRQRIHYLTLQLGKITYDQFRGRMPSTLRLDNPPRYLATLLWFLSTPRYALEILNEIDRRCGLTLEALKDEPQHILDHVKSLQKMMHDLYNDSESLRDLYNNSERGH